PLTSCTINYGYDGALNQTYPWTGNLAQYQTVTITLPSSTLAGGNHTFEAELVNPNGSTDENLNNNAITSTFTTVINGQTVSLALNLDCWGSETSWELTDVGGAVLYTGSGYVDDNPITINENFCLAFGCYNFKLMDSYGDGLTNCSAANGGNGSYQITYNSAVVAELAEPDAGFGTEDTQNFCLINDAGIGENDLTSKVSVYPNPAQESFAIVTDGIMIQRVELMNLAGQVIKSDNSGGSVVKLDVAAVSAGVYLVRIYSAEGTAIKQLVIK
ncbi:MAG: T9SS type A sorting domain-containing protein, partial [Flavobacteriia bacterium]